MFTGLSILDVVIVLVSIILSMALHEAVHAFVAHALGDTTAYRLGRLTLNPLKHIDLFTTILLPIVLILFNVPPFFIAKPVPFDPDNVKFGDYGAALVGIAGPLTNLLLAVIVALILRFSGFSFDTNIITTAVLFIEVNVAFFIINMIPFPPLDGSRLLYAFAPDSLRRMMSEIESAGFLPIIFFMLIVFQFAGNGILALEYKLVQFLLG